MSEFSSERERFLEGVVPHDLPIELIESAIMLARFLDNQEDADRTTY